MAKKIAAAAPSQPGRGRTRKRPPGGPTLPGAPLRAKRTRLRRGLWGEGSRVGALPAAAIMSTGRPREGWAVLSNFAASGVISTMYGLGVTRRRVGRRMATPSNGPTHRAPALNRTAARRDGQRLRPKDRQAVWPVGLDADGRAAGCCRLGLAWPWSHPAPAPTRSHDPKLMTSECVLRPACYSRLLIVGGSGPSAQQQSRIPRPAPRGPDLRLCADSASPPGPTALRAPYTPRVCRSAAGPWQCP